MINLEKFCAHSDEVRYHLHEPWRQKEGIVATNGHILVCIADDGRTLENPGDDQVKRNVSRFLSETRNNWQPITTALTPETRCPNPFCKSGMVECDYLPRRSSHVDCSECDGSKQVVCAYCDGRGVVSEPCNLGPCSLARRYLAILLELPGVEIAPKGKADMVLFRFDGGRGCVMPVRR